MAYQNVGTPRFYVNALEWLASTGAMALPNIFRTLPVVQENFATAIDGFDLATPPAGTFGGKSFIAILGHTFNSANINYGVAATLAQDNTINGAVTGETVLPDYDGWSLSRMNLEVVTLPENLVNFSTEASTIAGSVILGTYYDMPHSPDLNLTMTREYGGIKTIETKGGASLSNAFYTKPPMWGELGAWELHSSNTEPQSLAKSGRRIWDLSFSYLSDSSVFPEISNVSWEGQTNEATGTTYEWQDGAGASLLESDDFYSQVIHKTNGQLPFIFQPDKDNNSEFAICKFTNNFSFQQTAPNLYSVKMKIREVW